MSKPAKQAKSDNINVHSVQQAVNSNNTNNLQNITECSDEDNFEAVNHASALISTTMASRPVNEIEKQQNSENIPKINHKNLSQEWVNLNVGGTILTTTKTTLLKYSDINDHFLAKLISDKNDLPSTTDENGAFLVDRNPDFFKHVVNFLRNGRLDVPSECPLEGILSEAEFCNLRELVNLCKLRIIERDVELERQRNLQEQQNQKRVIYAKICKNFNKFIFIIYLFFCIFDAV